MIRNVTVLAWLTTAPIAYAEEAPILVIGDSVMAWNGAQSIPSVIASRIDRPVRDESVAGAKLSHRMRFFVGPMDIRAQVTRLPFSWVVATGGGNDLADECECDRCTAVLDTLISESGQLGEIPDFVTELRQTGARVLWVQYYDPPRGGGPFSACADEFATLDARLDRMAATYDGVFIADMGAVVDANDLSLYDRDLVHPSVDGSARIGRYLADTLITLDPQLIP